MGTGGALLNGCIGGTARPAAPPDGSSSITPSASTRRDCVGAAIWAWRCWPPSSFTTLYFMQFGVTPNILASYHMSFNFFIAVDVASNLLGAFASLFASGTDRVGGSNVVIYGLLAVGLLTAVAIPLTNGKWVYLLLMCLIGIVEGAILVATPALVRDFSPQLGRASAMGFWTIGPVAGSLITSMIALHTLNHFGQTHWKSQFVISGCAAMLVFVISSSRSRTSRPSCGTN